MAISRVSPDGKSLAAPFRRVNITAEMAADKGPWKTSVEHYGTLYIWGWHCS